MSRLSIFPDHGEDRGSGLPLPNLVCNDPASIQAALDERGVGFEQWPAAHALPPGADQSAILATYATEVARVKESGGYQTVDAIRMTPDHPERVALRSKFLAEHTHAEDEVRFFVEGQGLFSMHIGQEVLVTRPSKIRGLYFSSSHFPIDLLAAVPYRTIVLATGVLADPSSNEAAWLASWRPWLPLVSLLNLLRVARLLRMRPWQTLMRTYTSAQLFRLVALFLRLVHRRVGDEFGVHFAELRAGIALLSARINLADVSLLFGSHRVVVIVVGRCRLKRAARRVAHRPIASARLGYFLGVIRRARRRIGLRLIGHRIGRRRLGRFIVGALRRFFGLVELLLRRVGKHLRDGWHARTM